MIVYKKKKRKDRFQNNRSGKRSFWNENIRFEKDRFGMKPIVLIYRFGVKTTNTAYFNEKKNNLNLQTFFETSKFF